MLLREICLSIALCFCASNLFAQSPIPAFTGERVTTSGRVGDYSQIRDEIARIESGSDLTFYVIVIESSGSGKWATRDYIDELRIRWTQQSANSVNKLDSKRSTLILLAEKNRSISLNFGSDLESRYGLSGQAIERELVNPYFIPSAKAGNYVEGLSKLLSASKEYVVKREAQEAELRRQAVARAANLVANAKQSRQVTENLVVSLEQEIEESSQAGFDVTDARSTLATGKQKLSEATSKIDTATLDSLELSQQVQTDLQPVLDRLRMLPSQQEAMQAQWQSLSERTHKIEEAIEQFQRDGLATSHVQESVTQSITSLEAARSAVRTNPFEAATLLSSIERAVDAAQIRVAELPQRRKEVTSKKQTLESQKTALLAKLESAQQKGLNVESEFRQVEDITEQLKTYDKLAELDYESALTSVDHVSQDFEMIQQNVDRNMAIHRFQYQTLPIAIITALIVFVSIIAALRWLWYSRRRVSVTALFVQWKSFATELWDKLEEVKKRHQLLPFSDENFQTPLTGKTLDFYDKFDQTHDDLRKKWLELMETRQQVELLLQRANIINARFLGEAEAILKKLDRSSFDQGLEKCQNDLNQLQQSHDQARTMLSSLEQSITTSSKSIEQLRSETIQVNKLDAIKLELENALADGQATLSADPMGVIDRLEPQLKQVVNLQNTSDSLLRLLGELIIANDKLEETERLVDKRRGDGYLLAEAEANPDPFIQSASNARERCMNGLNRSEVTSAEAALVEVQTNVSLANKAIQDHLAAETWNRESFPVVRKTSDDLLKRIVETQEIQKALQLSFAQPTWSDLETNIQQATELNKTVIQWLPQIESNLSKQVQRFFAAQQLLKESQANQSESTQLLQQVHARRVELETLKEQCKARTNQLQDHAANLTKWFERHDSILHPDSVKLLQQAKRSLAEAVEASETQTPHWPKIQAMLATSNAGLQQSQTQGEQDVANHGQYRAEIVEAINQVRRVEQFLKSQTADRPRATQRLTSAQAVFALIEKNVLGGQRSWSDYRRQIAEANADVQKAEQWGQEDVKLAAQVVNELQEAERAISAAQAFYHNGVAASTDEAQRYLQEAQRLMARMEYEAAITAADRAEQSARSSLENARQIVEEQNRRRQLERQRAAATAAASAASRRASNQNSDWGFAIGASQNMFGSSSSDSFSSSSSSSSSSSTSVSSSSSQTSW